MVNIQFVLVSFLARVLFLVVAIIILFFYGWAKGEDFFQGYENKERSRIRDTDGRFKGGINMDKHKRIIFKKLYTRRAN